MNEEPKSTLPLKHAYAFGAAHGLEQEVSAIRNMEITWRRPSFLRCGYVVELFRKHGLAEAFNEEHWPGGNTPAGQTKVNRILRYKAEYEADQRRLASGVTALDVSNRSSFSDEGTRSIPAAEQESKQVRMMVNGREVELRWQLVDLLLRQLQDNDDSFAEVIHELAQSNVAAVRQAVASARCISEETVGILVTDSCPWVIEELVRAQRDKLSQSALIQIIEHNWSMVNRQIAQDVECYPQSDITVVSKLLADNADPSVRSDLASNCFAPKAIVRQLLKDTDPDVRRSAQNTLDTRH